jgi:hypothetical protein
LRVRIAEQTRKLRLTPEHTVCTPGSLSAATAPGKRVEID